MGTHLYNNSENKQSPMAETRQESNLREKIVSELSAAEEDISIIGVLDKIVDYAYQTRTSDIHFDPAEDKVVIRFRIDGVLQRVFEAPKNLQDEIISRIKVLSGLRTDEHNATQDGRFRIHLKDARFATAAFSKPAAPPERFRPPPLKWAAVPATTTSSRASSRPTSR
jgi:type II secretory ATPase GspE/PulE/Tfp pilus assembly ATPase PilB-like protein